MKKLGIIIALFLLFSAVSGGAAPSDSEFRRGLKFYNSKNYKAAVKELQEYVNKKPDPTAYYLIGYSLYKLGKFSEADEYFRQAYLIDPEFSLEKAGLMEKPSREIAPEKPASQKQPAAVSETKITKPEDSLPVSAEKPNQPSKSELSSPPEKKEKRSDDSAPGTTPKATAPEQQTPPSPTAAPSSPAKKPSTIPKQKSGAAASLPVGIIAPLAALLLLVLAIGLYIYKKQKEKGA